MVLVTTRPLDPARLGEIAVPLHREPLLLFLRAEFLTHYKLLVIPSTVGTEWVGLSVPELP